MVMVFRGFFSFGAIPIGSRMESIERAGRSLDGLHTFGCTYLLVRSFVSHSKTYKLQKFKPSHLPCVPNSQFSLLSMCLQTSLCITITHTNQPHHTPCLPPISPNIITIPSTRHHHLTPGFTEILCSRVSGQVPEG
jgi:hypothetical protein